MHDRLGMSSALGCCVCVCVHLLFLLYACVKHVRLRLTFPQRKCRRGKVTYCMCVCVCLFSHLFLSSYFTFTLICFYFKHTLLNSSTL